MVNEEGPVPFQRHDSNPSPTTRKAKRHVVAERRPISDRQTRTDTTDCPMSLEEKNVRCYSREKRKKNLFIIRWKSLKRKTSIFRATRPVLPFIFAGPPNTTLEPNPTYVERRTQKYHTPLNCYSVQRCSGPDPPPISAAAHGTGLLLSFTLRPSPSSRTTSLPPPQKTPYNVKHGCFRLVSSKMPRSTTARNHCVLLRHKASHTFPTSPMYEEWTSTHT